LTVTNPHIERVEKKTDSGQPTFSPRSSSGSSSSTSVQTLGHHLGSQGCHRGSPKAANNATSSQQSNTTHSSSQHSAHYHTTTLSLRPRSTCSPPRQATGDRLQLTTGPPAPSAAWPSRVSLCDPLLLLLRPPLNHATGNRRRCHRPSW